MAFFNIYDTMSTQFSLPVAINFDHDWSKINQIYRHLIESINQDKFKWHDQDEYFARIYNLGNLGGSMAATYEFTKPNTWYIWSGQLLEKLLPENILRLKQQIQDAGLNFVNIAYSQHQGSISKHVDYKAPGEADLGHCNLIFVISCTDPDACTVCCDAGNTDFYSSVPGSCWLLNTALEHQVNNVGLREILQIKIHSPFDQVKTFLENLPTING